MTGVDLSTMRAPLDPVRLRAMELGQALRAGGPLGVLETIGRRSHGGAVTRVSLGVLTPYVVTHPDHLEQVLSTHADVLPRGAVMWRPFSRLVGNGIAGEGPAWQASRDVLRPAFAGRQIESAGAVMSSVVETAVADLHRRAASGDVLNAHQEMTRIVQRIVDATIIGGRIPEQDGDRLGSGVATAMNSFAARMLLPWWPNWLPMVGDRKFKAGTRNVNQVLEPLVSQARRPAATPRPGSVDHQADAVSRLVNGRDVDGSPFTDRRVRDDLVGLFVAGLESSALALTWLWVALARHPQVLDRVLAEVDEVLGDGPVTLEAVRRLPYTSMTIAETLRVYSVGWAIPRMAAADVEIGGVLMPQGSTILISPYLTHRLPEFWAEPEVFDPERHDPRQRRQQHPWSYLPFGRGGHVCLGQHLFAIEAAMVAASVLRSHRPEILNLEQVRPRLNLTLQPNGPVLLRLTSR